MNIYIAARYANKLLVKDIYEKLESLGHSITHKWTDQESIKPYNEHTDLASRYAVEDIDGVLNADCIIVLSEKAADARGMYIELGVALAQAQTGNSKDIYLIPLDGSHSMFYFHPNIIVMDTFEKVLEDINKKNA